MPSFARPILVAAILSFLWFVVFSPLLSASWGPNLSADVVDRGQANVRSCERSWTTLWRMWECEAETTWQGGSPRDAVIMSPRELSGTTEVAARDKLRNGRATNATDFGDRTVVVPADMPADTFGGVMSMTALSLVAMLVIWGGAGIAVSILAKR